MTVNIEALILIDYSYSRFIMILFIAVVSQPNMNSCI
jgi:hypothetical protein